MAAAARSTRTTALDSHKHKEKGNRQPEGPSNSNSSGSVPKRYQSVFMEGTPLTSFGVHNDDTQLRSHSPSNHTQTQSHQRPLKPVKEFLTTQPLNDQRFDHRWPSNSQPTTHSRTHTEALLQNVNTAVSKSLKKLRQESITTATTANGRSSSLDNVPILSTPATSRAAASRSNNNGATPSSVYYQTKGSLPAQLITKRPSLSRTPSNRVAAEVGPTNGHRPATATPNVVTSIDTGPMHAPTPVRVPARSLDVDLHQLDEFNFDSVTIDDHYHEKSKRSRYESNPSLAGRSPSRKQSSTSRVPSADNQHRSLPEVSINPHIQSAVQRNNDQLLHTSESKTNGFSDGHLRSPKPGTHGGPNTNTGERRTNHHHIQVEPISTFKRSISPAKNQQVIDVYPDVILQHPRQTPRPESDMHHRLSSARSPHNGVHGERDNAAAHTRNSENTPTNNENESTSTTIQYVDHHRGSTTSVISPPSPVTQELNRIWKKPRSKFVIRSPAGSLSNRKSGKAQRPPGRLKNYDDESDSETTVTDTQSREEDMVRRHGVLPSDLGSDVWSDLTSEFSDTKMRKHPHIRTSTPNMTARSSSMSSKEIGQIRRQLTNLQVMYNDLLKLLDVDVESVRGSLKSSVSSQMDHHNRRHRFRKITPVSSLRHANADMGEVNQRFTRLESSVVTLAESIAKLSAQIQTQRTIKDDVFRLRQEVADLRQQLYQNYSRQQTAMPSGAGTSMSSTYQQPSRLITANVQRLAAINSTSALNFSSSYVPSSSTMQRSNSIIDPRQARKIEQFFGTEAMLRYFLSLLNYEEYAPLLEGEKIGIYELPYVSEKKLQSLGIPYGPCARIVYEAQQYFIALLTLKSNGIDV